MTLSLDRSDWQKVKFGDVVRNISDNVKDPAAAGIKRVLGLEHLEPGELSIQRWSDVSPESTFTRRVRPGQTLFGKRRAYQRKTAYAEFDAVCSGDILVFESADPTRLLPELLPFIAMTEAFYAMALETSAGSLSPRTRWSDIAKYEFDLPPLDEQRRIADLLWALESQVDAVGRVNHALDAAQNALVASAASAAHNVSKLKRLADLCDPDRSITYGIVQAGPDVPDGIPYIRVSDMTDGELSPDGMLRTSQEIARKYRRSEVREGDLVLALRGRPGLTLEVPASLDGANLTQGTARLAIDERQAPREYVRRILNSRWMARQISQAAKGSTFKELSLGALRDLKVPVPTAAQADRLLEQLDTHSRAQAAIQDEGRWLVACRSALLLEMLS